mgnify:CR=1 FL=1
MTARPTIVYLHGFRSSPASIKAARLSEYVAALPPELRPRLHVPTLTDRPAAAIAGDDLAAIDAAGTRDPAIGYSIAYPLGVVGPILCLYAFSRMHTPRVAPAPAAPHPLEVTLEGDTDVTVAELAAGLPPGVDIVAIRQGDANLLPDTHARLSPGDAVLLFGPPGALDEARRALGRVGPGHLAADRGDGERPISEDDIDMPNWVPIFRSISTNPAVGYLRIRNVAGYIDDNDVADTTVAILPSFLTQWVDFVASRVGSSSGGGVRYARAQFGTTMAVATVIGSLLAAWVTATVSRATLEAVPWLPWALYGVLALAFLLFGWMRVVVDDRVVRAVMGVGIVRKSVEIADIRKADIVRTRVLWGWGVHWTPAGWLYNVAGRWAVRLELGSERPVMIGTGDARGLHDAIEAARAQAAPRNP